jgi:hypothetical protein
VNERGIGHILLPPTLSALLQSNRICIVHPQAACIYGPSMTSDIKRASPAASMRALFEAPLKASIHRLFFRRRRS